MKKEIKKEIRKAGDLKLIFWQQDFNREGGEWKYKKEFMDAVNKEICRRGHQKN